MSSKKLKKNRKKLKKTGQGEKMSPFPPAGGGISQRLTTCKCFTIKYLAEPGKSRFAITQKL
jgi:hypothetical protein